MAGGLHSALKGGTNQLNFLQVVTLKVLVFLESFSVFFFCCPTARHSEGQVFNTYALNARTPCRHKRSELIHHPPAASSVCTSC